jgi:hypothetical protein
MIKFHHIGFVVENIQRWESNMIYNVKIKEVYDELQNAHLSLYENFHHGYIELIQPANELAFTYNFLKRFGNQFHHICYEADSLETVDDLASKTKLHKVLDPIPAKLFDNNLVVFYYNRNRQIVEFLINPA